METSYNVVIGTVVLTFCQPSTVARARLTRLMLAKTKLRTPTARDVTVYDVRVQPGIQLNLTEM